MLTLAAKTKVGTIAQVFGVSIKTVMASATKNE
jgi:hypothetical protein